MNTEKLLKHISKFYVTAESVTAATVSLVLQRIPDHTAVLMKSMN